MPKVSIIVAAYNIEQYIEKCLESLINQTYKEIEIIIVNDGSTDSTLEKIVGIADYDNRLNIIDKKNGGLIEARKSGLNAARGDYILFVDGDDWIHLETIDKLYTKALDEKADIVLYNFYFAHIDKLKACKSFNSSIYQNTDHIKNSMLCYILPSICTKFIKREFLICNNINFPSNISYAEDLATTISLFLHNPKLAILDDNLYYYFQREDSITKRFDEKVLEIPKAVEHIKNYLIKLGVYENYLEEFNYLAYTHIYYNQIICASNYYDLHKKLDGIWRRENINIKKNKYYMEYRNKCSKVHRLMIDIFTYNYNLGVLCFKSIKVFKKYKNKVLFHLFSN